MMRFLANENIGGQVVRMLRDRGHDVAWVREMMRGARDIDVLRRANDESRVLVTQDKDFGELVVKLGLGQDCGVVLFRLTGPSPEAENSRMVAVLDGRSDWAGHFSVVTDQRIRMRELRGGKA